MILVCGEALFDMFAEDTDGDLKLDARIGGSPFNVAVGLARLERPVSFFAGLSNDLFGRRLQAALKAEGVDLRHAIINDRLTTLSVVDVGPDGSPEYAFYGEKAADRQIESTHLPVLDGSVEAIHIGSFSVMVEPVGSSLVELVKRESARCVISYDPNIRPTVVADMQLWRDRLEDMLGHIHILKISAEDLEHLYAGASSTEVAQGWLKRGTRLVVVTRGGEGAEAHTRSGMVRIPGIGVKVVDTVGAGDTFQAAMLAALSERGLLHADALNDLDGELLSGVLSFAAQAAALTCSRRGANLPRRAELAAPLVSTVQD
ncbi:carbohydrate kinase [Stappia sp. F7233]|uniref:Carbohydrate kinase n=1 Tax=Stappia albiluteola TaxID=2758565 RepID=A0A839ABH2_9HYPH|nr:carbohydrate kinase [Stappia albiluteola]MBA5776049.1 carbohydrate kinase [Stappia albiluteola]